MTRISILGLIVTLILGTAYTVITLYDESLQIGRMWETPVVRPHETPIPAMADGVVPLKGGELFYRTAATDSLTAPMNLQDAKVITLGKTAYVNYCIHCHGKYFTATALWARVSYLHPETCAGSGFKKNYPPVRCFTKSASAYPMAANRPWPPPSPLMTVGG